MHGDINTTTRLRGITTRFFAADNNDPGVTLAQLEDLATRRQRLSACYTRSPTWQDQLHTFEKRMAEVIVPDLREGGLTEARKNEIFGLLYGKFVTGWPAAFFFEQIAALDLRGVADTTEWTALLHGCFPLAEAEWEAQKEIFCSWLDIGTGSLKSRAKTTCRECSGRGHCATIIDKSAGVNKSLKEIGYSSYKSFQRKGLLPAFKESRPAGFKAMHSAHKSKGTCKGAFQKHGVNTHVGTLLA